MRSSAKWSLNVKSDVDMAGSIARIVLMTGMIWIYMILRPDTSIRVMLLCLTRAIRQRKNSIKDTREETFDMESWRSSTYPT